ncbi:MAG: phage tail protein [bacterium]|nr:phage tail protein [bacterium]
MPEYLSPGVYVEEIDAGPKPIEGVSTSTSGAVGVTERGPTTEAPVLVTSFADFQRVFGGFVPEPGAALRNQWAFDAVEGGRWWLFPLSVKGFFDNGGQRIYVKRVFSSTSTASNATLGQGLVAELDADAADTATSIRLRHLLDVDVGANLNLFAGGVALAANPFAVVTYDAVTRSVELNQPIGQELTAGRDFAEVHARQDSVAVPPGTLRFTAKARGDWGGRSPVLPGDPPPNGGLSVRVRPMVGMTLNLLPDPATGGASASTTVSVDASAGDVTINVADVAGLANGDRVLVAGNEYDIAAVAGGVPGTFDVAPAVPVGETWAVGTSLKRMRPANDSLVPTPAIHVWNAGQLYNGALVELDNGTAKEQFTVSTVNGNEVTLSANVIEQYYAGHKLRVVEAEVSVRLHRPEDNSVEVEEVFGNLRLVDEPAGSLSFLETHVNTRSQFVDVSMLGGFSSSQIDEFPYAFAFSPANAWQEMQGGADLLNGLSVDDFVGVDGGSGHRTGIEALQEIDEISICMAPNIWSSTVGSALIQHSEVLKDRFAIIDPQDGLSIAGIRSYREPVDTKYAALYYPWIEVRDPSTRRNAAVAPSAHMAGIYARVDVERGVHKAPANEIVRGITRRGFMQQVTKREQDMLNPEGINALRTFPGRGHRVWGARTLSSDGSWKYINVRRLFLFVEESIDEGTQWVVFEPNDEPLWARVRQSIRNFLTTVWRSGALQGVTAEEAFFVICDRTTMTQDDIDNGRLICLIGIAPVKPAEFVIFRIQQKTLDATAP